MSATAFGRPALAALAVSALLVGSAHAQPTIAWYTIDCGGGTSAGGAFTLTGTIGQHDAGPASTGGGFTLTGGFWPGIGSCPADWNGDSLVNSNDISALLTSWLDSVQNGNLIADFDGSGSVNSNDISAFLTAWLNAVQNGC